MDEGWVFLFALLPLLLLVGAIDARQGRIPDAVNGAIAALGAFAAARDGMDTLVARGIDAVILGLLLLLLRRLYFSLRGRTGLGLGDVKFLAAATLWTGLAGIPLVIFLASIAALGVVGLRGLLGARPQADMRLRFGPYLALALWVTLVADWLIA